MTTTMSFERPRVAMLVMNPVVADARVHREASTLTAAGYDVRLFALATVDAPPGTAVVDGYDIERIACRSLAERVSGRRSGDGAIGGVTGRSPMKRALRRVAQGIHRSSLRRAFANAVAETVSAFAPDVVHAHDLETLGGARRIARRHRSRLVYDSHELWRHRHRRGEWRPVAPRMDAWRERRWIRDCDLVITVSDGIANWLRSTYGLTHPVEVVRNIPSPGRPSQLSLRRDGVRTLLYTGRVAPGRGLEAGIVALRDSPDDVVLTTLGPAAPGYLSRLREVAVATDMISRLVVHDPVPPDEVVAVAATADLAFIGIDDSCLSHVLSLPNKLFEAVHAGLPVVAPDLPEIAAFVERYGAGRLFLPNDARSIATAIRDVLHDPDRFRAGAARAASETAWEDEAKKLVKAYTDLGRERP